jgi:hypothetical protein
MNILLVTIRAILEGWLYGGSSIEFQRIIHCRTQLSWFLTNVSPTTAFERLPVMVITSKYLLLDLLISSSLSLSSSSVIEYNLLQSPDGVMHEATIPFQTSERQWSHFLFANEYMQLRALQMALIRDCLLRLGAGCETLQAACNRPQWKISQTDRFAGYSFPSNNSSSPTWQLSAGGVEGQRTIAGLTQ